MTDNDRLVAEFARQARRLLATLGREPTVTCDPDPPGNRFFLAEACVEAGPGRVRITYGDREFEIRTRVHVSNSSWPLALAYYLEAMDLDRSALEGSMWCRDIARIRDVLSAHISALIPCLEHLEEDPKGWWSRAEAIRQADLQEGRIELRRREMNVAAARSAEAFREGRYEAVLALLTPYEDILEGAVAHRLRLARGRAASPESNRP